MIEVNMSPLVILAIGMAIVVGGVLALRLHAFLALLLAALCVAALTPRDAVYREELSSDAARVVEVDAAAGTVTLRGGSARDLGDGSSLVVLPAASSGDLLASTAQATLRLENLVSKENRITATFASSDAPSVGDLVVNPIRERAARATAGQHLASRVATGFGRICASIGIVIAMAAIIGKCLLDSGAAERIVAAVRRVLGESRTPLALVISGFVVGIPVFFDTVFYLLMPLGKAGAVRSGKNYLLYVLSIVAGATMAHSLVPPTPGPLLAASELGVPLGVMMLGGIVVGSIATSAGYVYALWANRRWEIPLRPSVELTAEQLQAMAHRDESTLPPLWLSVLPILLPVVLIAGSSILDAVEGDGGRLVESLRGPLGFWGDKNIALVLGAALAMGTLIWSKRLGRDELAAAAAAAIASGGVIILITAAGGAFGHVLRQTGIADQLAEMLPTQQVFLLPLAFLLTAMIRTAQGSATVAMITAVGIMAPIAASGSLGFDPVYVALAIGCGSKPINWMNDSGFWIISKMSGMTEAETLKTSTIMMIIMGVVGLVVTMLGAWLLPLTPGGS
jgi:GntP family gluconate:H+ symporter